MSQKTYGMNPEEVKHEGDKLVRNAGEFSGELAKLVKFNNSLEEIWKGSGSEAYFTKWNEKKESINKLQKWLESFANATVETAKDAIEIDGDVAGMIK